MNLTERMKANAERRYKAECRRMGAELKDIDVYKQHKRNEWGEMFIIVLFVFLFGAIIFLAQDFDINFNMDDNTAEVMKGVTEAQLAGSSAPPSQNYYDGCIYMFNKLAGENYQNVVAIDGVTRQDCIFMEAQK